jgi:phospholipase D1/2
VRAVLAWSHHQKLVMVDNRVAFVGGLDLCLGRFDNESHRLFDGNHPQVFPGKDYCNPCIRELVNVRDLSKDEFDRNNEPRLPWHDVSCVVRGTVVSDIARHFIQQWNYAKTDKHKGQVNIELLTVSGPAREEFDESSDNSEDADFLVFDSTSATKQSGFSSKGSKVQFLRSVSWWSIGLRTEASIQLAYCELISAAKNFIYIENQFFITTASSSGGDVINRIGAAIADRLVRADRSFRVYIVMPVMPAFENKKLFESSGYVTRVTLNLQLQSLVKGETSIVGRIRTALNCSPAHALDIFHSHVSVCGLRQIDLGPSHGTIFTEQIYVHSKAMIVDDNCAIIGSANINDRSMLGNRDSEIALVIEDESFAKSLRIKLWHEHFGLNTHDQNPNVDILNDPPSDACFRLWKDTARTNAEIYRKVFGVVPCDEVKTRTDFAARIELNSSNKASLNAQNANAMHLIAQITGRIVAFQFGFLENEQNWNDPMPTSASFCPKEVFT